MVLMGAPSNPSLAARLHHSFLVSWRIWSMVAVFPILVSLSPRKYAEKARNHQEPSLDIPNRSNRREKLYLYHTRFYNSLL
jgi:hypothetical protein